MSNVHQAIKIFRVTFDDEDILMLIPYTHQYQRGDQATKFSSRTAPVRSFHALTVNKQSDSTVCHGHRLLWQSLSSPELTQTVSAPTL